MLINVNVGDTSHDGHGHVYSELWRVVKRVSDNNYTNDVDKYADIYPAVARGRGLLGFDPMEMDRTADFYSNRKFTITQEQHDMMDALGFVWDFCEEEQTQAPYQLDKSSFIYCWFWLMTLGDPDLKAKPVGVTQADLGGYDLVYYG